MSCSEELQSEILMVHHVRQEPKINRWTCCSGVNVRSYPSSWRWTTTLVVTFCELLQGMISAAGCAVSPPQSLRPRPFWLEQPRTVWLAWPGTKAEPSRFPRHSTARNETPPLPSRTNPRARHDARRWGGGASWRRVRWRWWNLGLESQLEH